MENVCSVNFAIINIKKTIDYSCRNISEIKPCNTLIKCIWVAAICVFYKKKPRVIYWILLIYLSLLEYKMTSTDLKVGYLLFALYLIVTFCRNIINYTSQLCFVTLNWSVNNVYCRTNKIILFKYQFYFYLSSNVYSFFTT